MIVVGDLVDKSEDVNQSLSKAIVMIRGHILKASLQNVLVLVDYELNEAYHDLLILLKGQNPFQIVHAIPLTSVYNN